MPDQAERQLADEIEVAVRVEIDEAVPLADVQVLKPIGPPGVRGRLRRSGVLEVPELIGVLLQEQIEIAVAVDVDELRPRHVQPAEKRLRVRAPGFVEDGKWRDFTLEAKGGGRLKGCSEERH